MAAPNPWLDRLELRSQNPVICPFLRAVEDDDRLLVPIEAPDALNRCAALQDANPAVASPAGARLSDKRARQLPALPPRRARRR
jgi:hypothetical protein